MEDCGDSGRSLFNQVSLDLADQAAHLVGILVLRAGGLADVAYAVGDYLAAFLAGYFAVDHQFSGVYSVELGGLLFEAQAVIDRIDLSGQSLVLAAPGI